MAAVGGALEAVARLAYAGLAVRDTTLASHWLMQWRDDLVASGRGGVGTDGGPVMEFFAILDQVIELLRQRGRVTYRALQLQFQLDDASLEVLKEELIKA